MAKKDFVVCVSSQKVAHKRGKVSSLQFVLWYFKPDALFSMKFRDSVHCQLIFVLLKEIKYTNRYDAQRWILRLNVRIGRQTVDGIFKQWLYSADRERNRIASRSDPTLWRSTQKTTIWKNAGEKWQKKECSLATKRPNSFDMCGAQTKRVIRCLLCFFIQLDRHL